MISGNFNDHADFEFDPASLPIIRLWSASSPLDSNTDVLEEGLGLTPFPNDYDNECNDEDDVPELSSGSSSSDLSPGTILETPLEITPDLTPESTDQSPSKVTEFDESSPYLSPNDGVWPDTPSEVFSGPSPSQNATTIRKRQTTSGAIVRRRSTSDALESQIPIEFAGLSRPAPLPPIIKKIRCVPILVCLTLQKTHRSHEAQSRQQHIRSEGNTLLRTMQETKLKSAPQIIKTN